ncbi:MAG: PAS domain-containing sensor histidine kinase [Methanobacterium sp.]
MLPETEFKFNSMIDQLFNGIFICNENGLIINCNSAQEEITGIKRFEMIEKPLWSIMFKLLPTEFQTLQNYRKIKKSLQNLFKTGKLPFENNSHIYEIELDNGIRKKVETRVYPIKTENGFVTYSITKDLTLDENAKKALKESKTMYKTIFENTGTSIVIIEENGIISLVNSEFEKFSGYSKEVIEGKMSYEKFIADEEEKLKMGEYHQLRTVDPTIPSKYEFKFLDKCGNIKHAIITVALITGTKKRLVSLLDITERKEVEERLKESKEYFKRTFDNSPIGAAVVSLDYKFLRVNQKLCEITGYTPEELTTMTFVDITHPDDINKDIKQAKLMVNDEIDSYEMDKRYIKKDGSIVWIRLSVRMVKDILGNQLHYLPMMQDITERKKAENEIKKSLHEKEILFKEIHHRIKNNMQIISSLLGLQSLYVNDKRTSSILKESQERVKSMAIVHEKLYSSEDFTKINIKEYTKDLSMHLLSSFNAGNIKLDVKGKDIFLELDHAIPCGLIINELVTNSIKYAFPHHTINDYSNNYEISINMDSYKNEMIVTVSDNGIGIPEDHKFENSDSLGFLIVNTLVNQINGKIRLINKTGTTFEFRFPCN